MTATMTETTMRCAIYARVSTEERDRHKEASCERQIALARPIDPQLLTLRPSP